MNNEDAIVELKILRDVYAYRMKEYKTRALDMAIKALSAEPKKGKWINDIRYSWWTCSECNYHDGNKTDKFCPNCGADMRGEEE